jgi:hypothetical protein
VPGDAEEQQREGGVRGRDEGQVPRLALARGAREVGVRDGSRQATYGSRRSERLFACSGDVGRAAACLLPSSMAIRVVVACMYDDSSALSCSQ